MKKFSPVPADKYQAQITDVNLVMQYNQFSSKDEERLNFEFTILDNKTMPVINEDGVEEPEAIRGRRIWKRIAPSNSPAGKKSKVSWFYKLLCAVEKKQLSEDELTELAPNTLVGRQVEIMVNIDGEWNNILSFGSVKKDMPEVPNAPERAKDDQSPEVKAAEEAFAEDPNNPLPF